ncbi:MAG: hypothetical protein J6333_01295 [Planctomycetes bacterium]|nr:hypothetical protein [Planctomycetota bacterium]
MLDEQAKMRRKRVAGFTGKRNVASDEPESCRPSFTAWVLTGAAVLTACLLMSVYGEPLFDKGNGLPLNEYLSHDGEGHLLGRPPAKAPDPSHPLETLLTGQTVFRKKKESRAHFDHLYPNAGHWYTLHRLTRVKYDSFLPQKSQATDEQWEPIDACIAALREANPGLDVSRDDFAYDPANGGGWTIRLFGPALHDLSPLKEITDARQLVLANCEASDLSALSELTELDELVLCNLPRLQDVSPLASLSKLTWLSLLYANVTDLRPLAAIPGLFRLDLTGNANLADISPLAHCQNLRSVFLEATNVRDVAPLALCPNLANVNLDGTPVVDVAALPPSVHRLTVAKSQLPDIARVYDMPGLSAFYFYNTPAYWRLVTLWVVLPGLLIICGTAAILILIVGRKGRKG